MASHSSGKNKRTLFIFIGLAIFLVILFFVALIVGKYTIGFTDFFEALFTNNEELATDRSVILNLRLPRSLMAVLVGAGLSVSGLVYQDLFQNKLVSPDFLGVSSGASVGAALSILLGMSGLLICLFSFTFGILTMICTLFIAKAFKNKSPIILLLSGIIMGGFLEACLSFIKFMADTDSKLGEITFWLLGSFQNVVMNDVYIILPISVICIALLMLIRWRINIVALGKEQAESKGLNYTFYNGLLIVIVTILTSASVAFAGVIGWAGLVVPHISRLIVGRNATKSLPLAIFIGAIFMLICDIISRSFTFSEIPLSAVSGFIGTPIFICILAFKKGDKNDVTRN